MESKQVQLYLDREKMIEASPVTSAECVMLTDGNNLQKVLDNDLTTPTVVHEESSFKTGVGDIDVSSSVVDGEVGRMVIKGKTYQNILPEPSTHVLTNNKEMFKVNEGLDPNVEIVDGVSKSAILKGQTLVNLIKGGDVKKEITYSSGTEARYYFNKSMLKANVDYLLIYEVIDFSGDDSNISFNENNGYGITQSYFNKNGIHKTKVNFSDVGAIKDFIIFYKITGLSLGGFINNVMLIEYQEGMENWDIPYFEGMQSVKLPVLTTTGKNLFDINHFSNLKNWDGKITAEKPYHSYEIKLEPNTTYTFSRKENSTGSDIYFCISKNKGEYDLDGGIVHPTNSYGTAKLRTITTDLTGILYFNLYQANIELDNLIPLLEEAQLEKGSTATSYEPYKSNILTVNEPVELRGIGDVQDTLDLMTGEVVERVGEVVLDGSENWIYEPTYTNENVYGCYILLHQLSQPPKPSNFNFANNVFPNITNSSYQSEGFATNPGTLSLRIAKDKLESADLSGFKKYLQNQPVTLQYPLATESIKTVDLSTSGNWEKVVLDGKSSENWQQNTHSGNFVQFEGYSNFCLYSLNLPLVNRGLLCDKLSYYGYDSGFRQKGIEGISDGGGYKLIFVRVKTEKLPTNDVAGFKQWLSQNPIEVSYMLSSNKDSTQVKQPIFFKDGHIQLSSGADNSLIPTLDYQTKTSNSYVMDLMKANTRYTMKAKSASGTFTIDGTSYGAGTNGTFTTPSSMTNKLLVMSDTAHEEVMILEGDVTSKTIPYFKGIKSAFEDEDKIEVLSTDSNLIINNQRLKEEGILYFTKGWNAIRLTTKAKKVKIVVKNKTGITGTKLNVKDDIESESNFLQLFAVNEAFTKIEREYSLKNSNVISFCSHGSLTFNDETFFDNYDIEVYTLDNMDETLVVEKSNSTKIPLLSPLRSLPNGVCDELIVDRMKKKGTLIQRVGKVVLNGSENWTQSQIRDKHYVVMLSRCSEVGIPEKYPSTLLCSHFINQQPYAYDREGINIHVNYNFHIGFLKNRLSGVSVDSCKKWLSQNPVTVYYELASPVVTEIDLENFPLVYKDGHIFLNSEIAPVVEIDYNINQSQQIQSNNETLQRHELDILDLDNLIVSFVNAEYNLRLLKFNMELSMMALAE